MSLREVSRSARRPRLSINLQDAAGSSCALSATRNTESVMMAPRAKAVVPLAFGANGQNARIGRLERVLGNPAY